MTFRRMVFQIFKANFRRYLLFFLCSSFTIMFYFTFYSLYINPDLNDPFKDNGISGNLYAPLLVIRVFAVLFIPYAQMAFTKFRTKDFGLFMVLGMTTHNIRRIILFENTIVAVSSILAGLGVGTVFSAVFFFIVSKIVDIGDSAFTLTMESYLHTIKFFVVIYLVVIVANLLLTLRYSILRLLKESRTASRNLIQGKVPGFIGIVLLGIAVYDMLSHYSSTNSNMMLRSLGISVVGIYLMMSGLGGWMNSILSRSGKSYHKHLLFSTDLNYTLGRSKIVLLLITFLVFITVSLSSLVFFLSSESQEIAVNNNPYHIAFTEVFGKNSISPETLSEIVDQGATPLISHQELQYIDLFQFKVFSDQRINALTGSDYHVEQGHFLNLSLNAEGNESSNQRPEMPTYEMKLSSGNKTLLSQGIVIKMLFNNVPVLMNGLHVIVNEQDYSALKAEHMNALGNLQLLNFKDWKKTAEIDVKINAALAKYNKDNTESWYGDDRQDALVFSTKSRISEYSRLKDSSQYGIFIFTFVGLLFFIASGVVLHFSILTDLEREKGKFMKLNKIGVTSKEATKIMVKPLKLLFFLPYVLGTTLATFLLVSTTKIEMSIVLGPLIISILTGTVYLCLQLVFYRLYTRSYAHKMLVEMGLNS